MKVKDNLIMFKSIPEMFEKEKDGRKPNTFRRPDNMSEIVQMDAFAREFQKGQKYIQIENSETGEMFVRRLTDISFYDGFFIYSWSAKADNVYKRYTKEEDKTIIEMREANLSRRDIAECLGRSTDSAAARIRALRSMHKIR